MKKVKKHNNKVKVLKPLIYNENTKKFDAKSVIIGNVADPEDKFDVVTLCVMEDYCVEKIRTSLEQFKLYIDQQLRSKNENNNLIEDIKELRSKIVEIQSSIDNNLISNTLSENKENSINNIIKDIENEISLFKKKLSEHENTEINIAKDIIYLKDNTSEVNNLKEQHNDLKSYINNNIVVDLNTFETSLNNLNKYILKYKNDIEIIHDMKNDIEKKFFLPEEEYNIYKNKVDKIIEDIENVNERIKIFDTSTIKKIEKLDSENIITPLINSLESKINSYKTKIDTIQSFNNDVENDLKSINSKISVYENDNIKKNDIINDISSNLSNLENNKIKTLSKELQFIKDECDKIKRLESTLADNNKKMLTINNNILSNTSDISRLENNIKDEKKLIDDNKSHIDKLRSDLTNTDNKIISNKILLDNTISNIGNINTEVLNFKNEIKDNNESIKNILDRNINQDLEISSNKKIIDKLNETTNNITINDNKYKTEINSLTNKLSKNEKDINTISNNITINDNKYNSLTNKISKNESDISTVTNRMINFEFENDIKIKDIILSNTDISNKLTRHETECISKIKSLEDNNKNFIHLYNRDISDKLANYETEINSITKTLRDLESSSKKESSSRLEETNSGIKLLSEKIVELENFKIETYNVNNDFNNRIIEQDKKINDIKLDFDRFLYSKYNDMNLKIDNIITDLNNTGYVKNDLEKIERDVKLINDSHFENKYQRNNESISEINMKLNKLNNVINNLERKTIDQFIIDLKITKSKTGGFNIPTNLKNDIKLPSIKTNSLTSSNLIELYAAIHFPTDSDVSDISNKLLLPIRVGIYHNKTDQQEFLILNRDLKSILSTNNTRKVYINNLKDITIKPDNIRACFSKLNDKISYINIKIVGIISITFNS